MVDDDGVFWLDGSRFCPDGTSVLLADAGAPKCGTVFWLDDGKISCVLKVVFVKVEDAVVVRGMPCPILEPT